MNNNIDKTLIALSTRIKEAGNGNTVAQKEVGKVFSTGQIIPNDATMAAFWSDLSEESNYYRSARHPLKREFSRPLNFITVDNDYAREINITPLSTIKEATDKALNLVEKHKKRTTYTYIVIIKKYDGSNELLALMGSRAVFGWTSSEARSNFASLPYKVTGVSSKEEALLAVEELKKSGVMAEFIIMNGLGENVTNDTGLSKK